MSKPFDKPFPSCLFHVHFACQDSRVFLVVLKHLDKFVGGSFIKDEGVHFIVETKTSAVQVSASHRAEAVVDHHDFGVVESFVIDVNLRTFLSQTVDHIHGSIWSEGDIRFFWNHDFNFHTSSQSMFNGSLDTAGRNEVRIDYMLDA